MQNLIRWVLADGGPGFCQFAITDACNASCQFCNFSREESPAESRIYADITDARSALDVLSRNGVGYIAFVGGEPTLHQGLPTLISHAKSLGMTTLICTNGQTLRMPVVERYIDVGLDSAVISIDAADSDTHEKNRGLPRVCQRIAEANAQFHDAGVSTTASVTISKLLGNFTELPGFLQWLGFTQVTFSYPLRSLDSSFRGYSSSSLVEYTDDELYAAFEEVKKLKKTFHVVNPTQSLDEMQRFVRGEPQQFPCLAGLKYFYLDWNLNLYRCHAWHEPMCHVFDLDESKLIRDGCTKCMIDCYRDASVLHYLGMALCDAREDLSDWKPLAAAKRIFNSTSAQAAMALLEQLSWVRGL